jgi:hypothetical protein
MKKVAGFLLHYEVTTSFHQVFLGVFQLDLVEMGLYAIVGHFWNYYVIISVERFSLFSENRPVWII